jgi:hypothetical protein
MLHTTFEQAGGQPAYKKSKAFWLACAQAGSNMHCIFALREK